MCLLHDGRPEYDSSEPEGGRSLCWASRPRGLPHSFRFQNRCSSNHPLSVMIITNMHLHYGGWLRNDLHVRPKRGNATSEDTQSTIPVRSFPVSSPLSCRCKERGI